ncbi:MAG: HAD family hydrolase [Alphaproteobacteria bacterium]|nr:HAD family hydrolase [Alphaproteobacteria bacterium]
MLDLGQYRAVIFDWDGTLVDSTDWVLGAHNHVRTTMGLSLWTKEDIFGCSSLSTRELYPKIYGENSQKAIELIADYTSKYNLDGAIPYEHAEELLKLFSSLNKQLGVVSNKRHEPLNEMIDHMKWREYFVSTIGAGRAERDKPHAAPLLMAMEIIDQDLVPADVLYVGDTETDLMTAQNTGCPVVFIQSEKPRPDLIEKYKPDYVFENLKSFADAVIEHGLTANKKAI